ncbi:MAG TPA: DUF4169 family protein [Rhizomicrobium sp.]|jgi:hypothetical protein|nr:DUF4169 family protein [Rhizomicrobium sp.]
MGELVNLRRVRKSKVRGEAEAQGAANRAKSGVSKISRAQAAAEKERTQRATDAHKIEKE